MSTRSAVMRVVRRYLPLEVAGAITAVLGATVAFELSGSPVHGAIAGTIGENTGYYGVALLLGWTALRRSTPHGTLEALRITAIALAVEFGPAELVDTFVARPGLMWIAGALGGGTAWSWFAGKLAADVVFYAVVLGLPALWQARAARIGASP